jgi:hypothetical protein
MVSIEFERKPGATQVLPPDVKTHIWQSLIRPDNILRLETANSLGHPSIEGVWSILIGEHGFEINEPTIRREIDEMVGQIMKSRGYDRQDVRRRRRLDLISSDSSFHPRPDGGPDQFNRWLDEQVLSPDDEIDPEKLVEVAGGWKVTLSVDPQDVVIGRLELGVKLRPIVPPSEYETGEFDVPYE